MKLLLFKQLITMSILTVGMLINHPTRVVQDEPTNPIRWTLKLEPADKPIRAGATFSAELTAEIGAGWHLYSLEEIPNGPRPTRITLPDNQVFALDGEINQPLPISKFDENFGVETQFYEESATFTIPVKINTTAKPGEEKLIIQTRYQTCNDKLCLPPKTVKLEATVQIK